MQGLSRPKFFSAFPEHHIPRGRRGMIISRKLEVPVGIKNQIATAATRLPTVPGARGKYPKPKPVDMSREILI
jgi:hypothetical protein